MVAPRRCYSRSPASTTSCIFLVDPYRLGVAAHPWATCTRPRWQLERLLHVPTAAIRAFRVGVPSPTPSRDRLVRLDARAKDDLLLASVLAPLGVTEVDAPILPQIFGLDASPEWGAVTSTAVDPATARALWARGNQRGGYTRFDSTAKCLLRRTGHIEGVDEKSEDHLLRAPALAEPK